MKNYFLYFAAMGRLLATLLLAAFTAPGACLVVHVRRASVDVSPTFTRQQHQQHRSMAAAARMMADEEDKKPPRVMTERDSLYDTPSFELDATTITALLGAAIAFQFFVLGNM